MWATSTAAHRTWWRWRRHIKGFCPAILGEVICTLGNRATQQLIISSVHYRSIGLDTEKIFVREYITGSILQLSVSCVNIWVYSKTNFYKHSQGYWSCWELPDNQYSYKICTLYRIRYHDRVPGLNNIIYLIKILSQLVPYSFILDMKTMRNDLLI